MSSVRSFLVLTLILGSLISARTTAQGSRLKYSVAIEHNQYRNECDMSPGSAVAVALIVDDPVIRRIGLQFTYSRLPYYRGSLDGYDRSRHYRRRITWGGLAAIKPFSGPLPLGGAELVITPGIGFVNQSTWHEILYEPEPWEVAGDHYTSMIRYFVPQVSAEIRTKLFGEKFDLAFGGIARHFIEGSDWFDGGDPPLLGLGYGFLLRFRGSF